MLAYVAGYLLTPPRVLLIVDEERYVLQASAFAQGRLTVPGASLAESDRPTRTASDYPPGTSLLQTPFVALAGWRYAGLASVLGLLGLILFTERLLRSCGYSGRFAIVVPLYAGALFFGRVAMSDAPAAALAALAVWLLACETNATGKRAFLAGVAAGATLVFREPVAVLLAPLVIGALVRGSVRAAPLLVGGLAAIAVRLALSQWLFGDPFFMRESDYRFSLSSAAANAGVYGAVFLVLFPLGAVLPFFYRGPRRWELTAGTLAYMLMFLCYDYRPWTENGTVKGTILASRFALPLLPVLAVMLGDAARRLGSALPAVPGLQRTAFASLVAAVSIIAFGVHPLMQRLEAEPYQIVHAIQTHSNPRVPAVINEKAAAKYLSAVYGPRALVSREKSLGELEVICRTESGMQVILLDREDSQLFQDDARANAAFLAAAASRLRLSPAYDGRHDGARLRIFDVGCSSRRSG